MGENNQVFAEEVRTELMSMFTGMALQGLAGPCDATGTPVRPLQVARDAVELADAAITALEEYHLRRRDELIAAHQAQAEVATGQAKLELVQ